MKNTNDKKYCVYAHINKINGKIYIGQTGQEPNIRWKQGYGYVGSSHFYNAIQKYGWDNFEHIILLSNLSLEDANYFEETLIKKLDTINRDKGYNLRFGATNNKMSEETKEKMRRNHPRLSGEKHCWYGKHLSLEHRKKIGESNKGKIFSKEHKRKISESHANVKGINHPRIKKIIQYDTDGNFIKVWDYVKQITNELGIDNSSVIKVCRGKLKSAGGYRWKYADDVNSENIAV